MTSSSPQVQEQQGRPIGRRPVSVRKGSGGRELGGRALAWKVSLAGRYMGVETEVGMLTSVATQLVDVLEISQIQVWKSASRFGDLRQGQAVSRGLRTE